jgi:cation diffusion facilitator CzcD-associated flavoprotein CzcO
VDLGGKRVGVVGIGATGIQVIQTIADEVAHLTVFARTPQYVLPMKSPSYGPEEQAEYKARFAELRSTLPNTFTGFEYDFVHVWAECSPEQRRAVLEEIYEDGSLKLWLATRSHWPPRPPCAIVTTRLQQQTEWISDVIAHVRERGASTIEPTKETEDAWVAHHDETSGATLIANTTGWYLGSNVPGKPRRVLSYTGGVGTYRKKCDEVARDGYPGFVIQ